MALPLTMTSIPQLAISAALAMVTPPSTPTSTSAPAAPGQLAHGRDPLAGAGRGGLAGPARADRQDQDQVGQAEHRLDRAAPACPG